MVLAWWRLYPQLSSKTVLLGEQQMRIIVRTTLAALFVFTTQMAGAQQNSPTELRQQIEAVVRGWVMAFRAGDAKAAAPYFASPSIAVTGLFGIVKGDPTERVAKDASVFKNFEFTVQDVGPLGSDGAWATGTFTNAVHRPDGTLVNSEGYALEVFRREGANWKVVATSYTAKIAPR